MVIFYWLEKMWHPTHQGCCLIFFDCVHRSETLCSIHLFEEHSASVHSGGANLDCPSTYLEKGVYTFTQCLRTLITITDQGMVKAGRNIAIPHHFRTKKLT